MQVKIIFSGPDAYRDLCYSHLVALFATNTQNHKTSQIKSSANHIN